MGFKGISIEKYLELHLKNNPDTNRKVLQSKLEKALLDFENGVKCKCGDDIWVAGSAVMGNHCFTCITGEEEPKDVYEIEGALEKNIVKEDPFIYYKKMENGESGYYNIDGCKLDPSKIVIPQKCLSCIHFNNPKKDKFCTIVRFRNVEGKEFKCKSYKKSAENS